MRKKLALAAVLVLLAFSMTSALAVDWGYWVYYPDGTAELIDPADLVSSDWDDGELGDESMPLYALGGLAAAALAGAVVLHKKRLRVG